LRGDSAALRAWRRAPLVLSRKPSIFQRISLHEFYPVATHQNARLLSVTKAAIGNTSTMIELFKELLDLVAFLMVTPEIIGRERLQQFVDRIKDEHLLELPMSPFDSPRFEIMLYELIFTAILLIVWLVISVSVTFRTAMKLDALGYLDKIPWWLSGVSWVTAILSVILIALVGFWLTYRIAIAAGEYALKQGISRLFLAIGLTAFLAARLLGITKAILYMS
jgi:hypothetical protein